MTSRPSFVRPFLIVAAFVFQVFAAPLPKNHTSTNGGRTSTESTSLNQATSPSGANIKDFGAAGDGVTDDTAAIQAAINSLPLNTGDSGILSPKGFANGGVVRIPRGRYKITHTITMRRGLRLIGESRESSQIISYSHDSVFKYEDSGRYIQDEIVIENISIWQDPSVEATSGAGIECSLGPAKVESIGVILKNIYIEKTYRGILLSAGVWCSLDNIYTNKCISYGFDIQFDNHKNLTIPTSTTSTTLKNCYASLCDSGFHIERGAYCSLISCGSDANVNYGYIIERGLGHSLLACGAEDNGVGGIYINASTGTLINTFITYGTTTGAKHGIVLNNAINTTILAGAMNAVTASGGFGIHIANPGGRVTIIGTEFLGNFTNKETDSNYKTLMLTNNNDLIGSKGQLTLGSSGLPEGDSKFAITGRGDSTFANAQKIRMLHTESDKTRNTEIWVQFASDNTPITYPLCVALFIANAQKGLTATHQRVAGSYTVEQTTGITANANSMVDAGIGTIPAGNWDHYSDSSRESFWKAGQFRFLSTNGPIIKFGKGSPEGKISAPVGSTYQRIDGGHGTSFYVKESGDGPTGWVGK